MVPSPSRFFICVGNFFRYFENGLTISASCYMSVWFYIECMTPTFGAPGIFIIIFRSKPIHCKRCLYEPGPFSLIFNTTNFSGLFIIPANSGIFAGPQAIYKCYRLLCRSVGCRDRTQISNGHNDFFYRDYADL